MEVEREKGLRGILGGRGVVQSGLMKKTSPSGAVLLGYWHESYGISPWD